MVLYYLSLGYGYDITKAESLRWLRYRPEFRELRYLMFQPVHVSS